jgi:hypothetical protein
MRIRTDSVIISSVLFTISLVCLVPMFWAHVITDRDKVWLAKLDDGYWLAEHRMSDLSVACLAVILIALIVIWTGYISRVRWTWAVMFIVVWVWAFPLLVLPLFQSGHLSIAQWLYTAIYYPGSASWAKSPLPFFLMVIALLLPVKSFFLGAEAPRPIHRRSPKIIGGSAAVVLLTTAALLAWIRLRSYEIPPAELYSWEQLPPPPPPPDPCWARGLGGK